MENMFFVHVHHFLIPVLQASSGQIVQNYTLDPERLYALSLSLRNGESETIYEDERWCLRVRPLLQGLVLERKVAAFVSESQVRKDGDYTGKRVQRPFLVPEHRLYMELREWDGVYLFPRLRGGVVRSTLSPFQHPLVENRVYLHMDRCADDLSILAHRPLGRAILDHLEDAYSMVHIGYPYNPYVWDPAVQKPLSPSSAEVRDLPHYYFRTIFDYQEKEGDYS